ncbi:MULTISPECIES: aldehyde dehydrogenase family protein [unclassified Rhodococcus (in: high G+C Gram-positive bacteria)]|uniref:aldehyde dehydrogenase family protein n=1 Tax=unclassified Rhodococcus (in: high G+C Gram-positive bacteria) TaxID=192944 RepID=UPI001F5BA571|nr:MULTISPECIES: aldehyde dehydrogenase family protein [unclassified Rhodococcus (in: high G+C Gram-positive bacteria)]
MGSALDKLDHWIAGSAVMPTSANYMAVTDPATGCEARQLACGNAHDVDLAVQAASAAETAWKQIPALARARLFGDLARAMRADSAELARLEISETGKPEAVALAEVENSATYFDFYGGLIGMPAGDTLDVAPDQHVYTRREAFGVIGVITPWNVPLNQAARACAPALAAGNTVVVKPSESTSASTVRLAQLATEVGFPAGVFNVVLGTGQDAGAALVAHPDVSKVAFTGSVGTGRAIGHVAADRIIPVTLELGGKSANIVFADADVEKAVAGSLLAFTANAGQVCSAGTRLLVHRSIHDEVVQKLAASAAAVRPGRDIGPLITRAQFERVQEYFKIAESEGAQAVTGGTVSVVAQETGGFYIDPTVYIGVDNSARIAREEIFGPVVLVLAFDTEDEAIELANDSDYGLVAGVWTSNVSRALRVSERIRVGQVFVNTWSTGSVQTPFGGWKNSGYGREKGVEALHHYSQVKCVTIKFEGDSQ